MLWHILFPFPNVHFDTPHLLLLFICDTFVDTSLCDIYLFHSYLCSPHLHSVCCVFIPFIYIKYLFITLYLQSLHYIVFIHLLLIHFIIYLICCTVLHCHWLGSFVVTNSFILSWWWTESFIICQSHHIALPLQVISLEFIVVLTVVKAVVPWLRILIILFIRLPFVAANRWNCDLLFLITYCYSLFRYRCTTHSWWFTFTWILSWFVIIYLLCLHSYILHCFSWPHSFCLLILPLPLNDTLPLYLFVTIHLYIYTLITIMLHLHYICSTSYICSSLHHDVCTFDHLLHLFGTPLLVDIQRQVVEFISYIHLKIHLSLTFWSFAFICTFIHYIGHILTTFCYLFVVIHSLLRICCWNNYCSVTLFILMTFHSFCCI